MAERICIIGYGRLGSTIASIVRATHDVAIIDNNIDSRQRAEQAGHRVVQFADVSKFQSIIICVPISVFPQTLRQISPHLQPNSIVMDTCSVKVIPAKQMLELLPQNVAIIATHPLFGPDSIKNGLEALTIVTHPVRATDDEHRQWDNYWASTGLRVVNATPDEHDQAISYSLGMTHFFGRIMAELDLQPLEISTVGYKALYEVMQQTNRDSWQLFHDMQRYNPHTKQMRRQVYEAIKTIEARLDATLEQPTQPAATEQ